MSVLNVHWWSPRHSVRGLASEVKGHGQAWLRLLTPASRAFTNFGDELNRDLMSEVTGRRIQWARLGREDVVAVGSVLVPYLTQGGQGLIWGSGINREVHDAERSRLDHAKVLAVRGPKTVGTLGLPPTTPMGDPGLLVRSTRGRRTTRRGKIVIPHFTVFQKKSTRDRLKALANAGYEVALPTSSPAEMIDRIRGADEVITTGMHGLILSHALGTPARLIDVTDEARTQPAFKYLDYFASVDLRPHLVPWSTMLDATTRRAEETTARDDLETVDRRIDLLIDGLHHAARPLI